MCSLYSQRYLLLLSAKALNLPIISLAEVFKRDMFVLGLPLFVSFPRPSSAIPFCYFHHFLVIPLKFNIHYHRIQFNEQHYDKTSFELCRYFEIANNPQCLSPFQPFYLCNVFDILINFFIILQFDPRYLNYNT